MRHRLPSLSAALFALAIPGICSASDTTASDTPSPVAATRPELKELLERSKQSHPRLPLPPPSEVENVPTPFEKGTRARSSTGMEVFTLEPLVTATAPLWSPAAAGVMKVA